MSHTIEATESWLHQLLHPGEIPEFALLGGMTPELAWEHWSAARAAEAKGLPHQERALSSAERWWYQRFDLAHLQERGADLGRTMSAADAERAMEAEAG
jgi:hypothetical protein